MKMMREGSVALVFCGILGLSVASCARKATVDTAAQEKVMKAMQAQDEATIRGDSAAWSRATQAKNLDEAVSFYAEDGSYDPQGAPAVTGKDAIRKAWQQLFALPGPGLSFTPTKIEVAESGDLAYEAGTYELSLNDTNGKPKTTMGKYVVVWKKQADGEWKAAEDIANTDQ